MSNLFLEANAPNRGPERRFRGNLWGVTAIKPTPDCWIRPTRIREGIKSVALGAIIVVGAKNEVFAPAETVLPANDPAPLGGPLACFEVLGRSLVERIIERFVRIEVDVISVLVEAETSFQVPQLRGSFGNVSFQVVDDAESAIEQKLREYSINGIQRSFVHCAEAYTETDLLDLFYFHREARQPATRACDHEGALALWVVDCAMPAQLDVRKVLGEAGRNGASYFVRGYVHRMADPRDLREIATHMLQGHFQEGASGKEIRPGVWIDEGARVHRRARIVGPAYIGCRSKVRADTLVTRCSSVERDCCVDYGTVIENSSLLPNTQIGIWLDVCHAIANGNKLFSLGRNVGIEISDPSVMRSTAPILSRKAEVSDRNEPRMSADFEHEMLTQRTWQLGANLIRE
jgi:hypothetical protein